MMITITTDHLRTSKAITQEHGRKVKRWEKTSSCGLFLQWQLKRLIITKYCFKLNLDLQWLQSVGCFFIQDLQKSSKRGDTNDFCILTSCFYGNTSKRE